MTAATAILTVRPIGPTDVDRLERMFYRLSPTTVYRRFFADPGAVAPDVDVVHERRP
jgi:hypothetical protein